MFESLEGRRLLDGNGLLDIGVLSDVEALSVAETTGEKPQSKVWQSADNWWAVLPDDSGTWLWRLDETTWTPTLRLSTETDVQADVKPVDDLAHILLYAGANSELVSIEHVGGGYQLWSERPELVNVSLHSKVETATIDIDSTGRMWLASDTKNEIEVRYSDYPYRQFSDPITLATGISSDDISVVTAFPNGTVGVFWSDQNDERFGFRIHFDGTNPNLWGADEVPASQSASSKGTGMADDHVNVAVTSDGTLYAAVKTGFDSSSMPVIGLLVRRPWGDWDDLYTVDTIGTRPIVIASEVQDRLVVAYTKSNGGNDILFKESPLDEISFSARQTLISGDLNDVTSTKEQFTDQLLALASDGGDAMGALIDIDPPPQGGGGDPPVTGEVHVVDDDDPDFDTTGDWNAGGLGDYQFSSAGSGNDIARWTFAVTPGVYEVAASWVPYKNRATDAPFRILDGTTEIGRVQIDQEAAPSDFASDGFDWEQFGQFTVEGRQLVVELSDDADEVVIADAVRIEQIASFEVTSPEIAVAIAGQELASGDQVDFGNTLSGSPVERQLTITNAADTGEDPLVLGSVIVPPGSGFTLLDNIAGVSLLPGQSVTLRVVMDAAAGGGFSASLALGSNDVDESPFVVDLVGNVSVIVSSPPEIAVTIGGSELADGGQIDFGDTLVGNPVERQLTITNAAATAGPDPLVLGSVTVPPGSGFTLLDNIAGVSLLPGQSVTLRVVMDAAAAGDFSASLALVSNDADESPFVVDLVGNVSVIVSSPPEIAVTIGGSELADGGQIDFGDTLVGNPVERQLTITNAAATAGPDPLVLGSVTVPPGSGFTLLDNIAGVSLLPGQSVTLRVVMDAAAVGGFSASLSLGSNDADESPFDIVLAGSVIPGAPVFETVMVVDDGDPGFSFIGDWRMGGLGSYLYSPEGNGGDVARWTFAVSPGVYEVAASWIPYKNRAEDAPYRVLDGATEVDHVPLNQTQAPNDFSDGGFDWERLGQFTILGSQLVVELSDDANGVVIADAIRIEQVASFEVTSPEIDVTIGGQALDNGDPFDFGSTPIGSPVERQFTVTNAGTVGSDPLILGTLTLPYASGFVLLDDISGASLLPGQSASFRVAMDAAVVGSLSTTLSLANNDTTGDEAPFEIRLSGQVHGSWQIVDDTDSGFSTQGDWRAGGLGNYMFSAAGSGADVARWSFTVTPGIYEVSTTWVPYKNRATDAPYRVLAGDDQVGLVGIDQQQTPNDFSAGGYDWQRLGQFEIAGNQLVIELSDNADQYVIADAVRIEQVGDLAT